MLKNISSTLITKLITAVLSFIVVVITTHAFGASGRGIIGILNVTIYFTVLVSGLIGGNNLVYLSPRRSIFNLFFASYIFSLIICVLSSIFVILIGFLPSIYFYNVLILSIITCFWTINSYILIGKKLIKENNNVYLLSSFINIVVIIVLFKILHIQNIASYIYSMYFYNGIIFLFSLIIVLKEIDFRNEKFAFNSIYESFKFGLYAQFSMLLQYFTYRSGYFFLNLTKGLEQVGIFSTAFQIVDSVWIISKSIALVQYSEVSNSKNTDDSIIQTLYLAKIGFIVTAIVFIPMLIAPKALYSFVFGSDFGNIKTILLIFTFGAIVFGYSTVICHYFSGIGKYYYNTILSAIGLVLVIIPSVIFYKFYDMFVASLITSSSLFLYSILVTVVFIKIAKIKITDVFITKNDILKIIFHVNSLLKKKR
jgi:O-antigen/teichoic acid export membrane protein